MGAARGLSSLLKRQTFGAAIVSVLNAEASGAQTIDEALSQLWVAGAPLDWSIVNQTSGRQKAILPTYPFERDVYWIEPPIYQPEGDDLVEEPAEPTEEQHQRFDASIS